MHALLSPDVTSVVKEAKFGGKYTSHTEDLRSSPVQALMVYSGELAMAFTTKDALTDHVFQDLISRINRVRPALQLSCDVSRGRVRNRILMWN